MWAIFWECHDIAFVYIEINILLGSKKCFLKEVSSPVQNFKIVFKSKWLKNQCLFDISFDFCTSFCLLMNGPQRTAVFRKEFPSVSLFRYKRNLNVRVRCPNMVYRTFAIA